MHKRALAFLVFFLTIFSENFAQENTDHFIRDYVAPDFKLRQLTLTGGGNGNGDISSTLNSHSLRLSSTLDYYKIANRQKYQGSMSSSYDGSTAYGTTLAYDIFNMSNLITNSMQNRFYFKEKWFIGFHDRSQMSQVIINNSTDSIPDFSSYNITVRPAISIGFGRVEWVQFARQAIDLERSLSSSNRLNTTFTDEDRTILSNKIAMIRNRRYYDTRLGRIDQLQALDSIFQNEGMITSPDITYFSQMQDAFLYSYNITRLSGFRHQLGATQGVAYTDDVSGVDLTSYAFYLFEYFLPQSYALQHNFRVSLIGGIDSDASGNDSYPAWADAMYTLGFYPTTRTHIELVASAGMNIESDLGYIYGASIIGYYYISPRFRFNLLASFQDGENYRAHNFSHVAVSNSNRFGKLFDYSFSAGVSFEIF